MTIENILLGFVLGALFGCFIFLYGIFDHLSGIRSELRHLGRLKDLETHWYRDQMAEWQKLAMTLIQIRKLLDSVKHG